MKILLGFGDNVPASNAGVAYWNLRDGPLPADWSGKIQSISAPGVLAHYEQADVFGMLREWADMMIPGGELLVSVPNAPEIARSMVEARNDLDYTATLYGDSTPRRSLWDERGLSLALRSNGFGYTERVHGETPYTLIARGRTATESLEPDGHLKGVYGVMSVPRLGFVGCQKTMNDIAYVCGVPFSLQETVFWGQGLTRGIEEAIAKGARYVLTMDYDTYCHPRHVYDLVRIADQTGVDALAAGQMRRGITQLLAYMDEPNARKFHEGETLCEASSAHFGLTLLRTSALAKMERPWFEAKAAPDGTWGDGKVDEDIVFWQKWKVAGNSLAVTPQVCIGHFELVMSCVGYDGSKVYVSNSDKDLAHKHARF